MNDLPLAPCITPFYIAMIIPNLDVLAFVEPVPGQTPDAAQLWAWCTERPADFNVPRFIQIVELLPKTSTGQLQKSALRERVLDRSALWDHEA